MGSLFWTEFQVPDPIEQIGSRPFEQPVIPKRMEDDWLMQVLPLIVAVINDE